MSFSTLKSIRQKIATGKGFINPFVTQEMLSGGTAVGQNGGWLSMRPFAEEGSTYPGTLNDTFFPQVSGSNNFLIQSLILNQVENPGWLCRFYRMGTVNLAATGSQFTADAATFPVRRTIMGVSNVAIPLVPLLYITTATTTTAFVFRLQTGAGGNGYEDEAGTATVGTVSLTAPSAAMATGTAMPIFPNPNGPMISKILDVRIDTASATGAATIWGAELLMPFGSYANQVGTFKDGLYGGLCMPLLEAASPVSGSLTSFLGCISVFNTSNQRQHGYAVGVVD